MDNRIVVIGGLGRSAGAQIHIPVQIPGHLPLAEVRVAVGHAGHHRPVVQIAVHRDPADTKLILPAIPHSPDFAVAPFPRGLDGKIDLMVTVYHKEFPPNTGAVRMKDLPRGGVDAQNDAFPVQQDKPLAHVFCDLLKFLGFPSQRPELCLNLPVLLVDTHQERGQFLVRIIFQRVVQIQIVQRRDNAFRHPVSQHSGENDR